MCMHVRMCALPQHDSLLTPPLQQRERTPLFISAYHGHTNTVLALLQAGAAVDARDAVYCFSLPLSLLYVYVSCTCALEPDHIHKGLQVEMKSGGGISKGSEGVFQTHESAGLDSHKHWTNHLVQICFKSKEKQNMLQIKGKTISSSCYTPATH